MIHVIRLQLVDVQRLARVHALAALHEVECKPLVVERVRVALLQFGVHVGMLAFQAGERRVQSPIAARGSPALVAGILVARHLDVDMRRRLSGDSRDFLHDAKRLVDAAAQSRRARHLVDRHPARLVRALEIALVYLRLEFQQVVVEYLHEVHGSPHAARMVRIAFQQDVHDGLGAVVGGAAQPAQKLARQPSPSGVAPLAKPAYLRIAQTVAVSKFDLALQNGAILEHSVPQNNILGHSRIGFGQLVDLEDLAEVVVRGELRLERVLTLPAGHVVRAADRLAALRPVPLRQPFLHRLVGHALALLEEFLHDAQAISRIEAITLVAVLRPLRAIQLVQHAEHLVGKRAARQHRLAFQVGAGARHAPDEVLRALIFVDDVFPVPRVDALVFHSLLARRPRKARLPLAVNRSVFRRQRPHVIGDAERHEGFQLAFFLCEEGIVPRLPLDDGLQLFQMQLVGNGAVVARFKAPQKRARLDRALNGCVPLVFLRADIRKQLPHLFEEVLVREFARAQVVFGVALRLVRVVVVRPLVKRTAEELVVALGPVGTHQALERLKVAGVALVLPHLAKRERLALRLAQNAHQHVGRVHLLHRLEQVAPLVGARVRFDLLIVGERELAALGFNEEDVRELGRISHHGGRHRFGQLLVRFLDAERRFGPLALLGRPQRSVAERPNQSILVESALDVMFLAPVFKRFAQPFHRFFHIGVSGAERRVVLMQEIAPMLHDVVKCEVDEADVRFLVRLGQPCAQMVDGGKALVVVGLGEARVVEQRPAVIAMPLGPILRMKPRLVHANEELRIDLGHFGGEYFLEPVKALPPAVVASALPTVHPRIGRRLSRRENAASPRGFPLEAA